MARFDDSSFGSEATNVGYGGPGNESLNPRRPPDVKEAFNVAWQGFEGLKWLRI